MSCCRPSPSKKEVLSRDTNERIEMSAETKTKTKAVENVKKKKRKKYLDFKVLDNYVFARESEIPSSQDTKHADIDIFVKVPLRQNEGRSGLNSNPPSPVPPPPPSPISTSMSPRNLEKKIEKEHDIGGKDSPSREEMMWLDIDDFLKSNPSNGADENMERWLNKVFEHYGRDLNIEDKDDHQILDRVYRIAEKYCPPSPKLKKRKSRSPPRSKSSKIPSKIPVSLRNESSDQQDEEKDLSTLVSRKMSMSPPRSPPPPPDENSPVETETSESVGRYGSLDLFDDLESPTTSEEKLGKRFSLSPPSTPIPEKEKTQQSVPEEEEKETEAQRFSTRRLSMGPPKTPPPQKKAEILLDEMIESEYNDLCVDVPYDAVR